MLPVQPIGLRYGGWYPAEYTIDIVEVLFQMIYSPLFCSFHFLSYYSLYILFVQWKQMLHLMSQPWTHVHVYYPPIMAPIEEDKDDPRWEREKGRKEEKESKREREREKSG